jgi:HSP20 family protein
MTKSLMRPFTLPTLFPSDIFGEFERFFTGLDTYDPNTCTLSLKKFPKGDIFLDEDGNRVIELALAGYSKDQLSVVVEDGKLTVSAEKCEDSSDERRTLARRAFRQVFSSFGDNFNLEGSEVTFKDGLLRVKVPKVEKPEEVAKSLPIK